MRECMHAKVHRIGSHTVRPLRVKFGMQDIIDRWGKIFLWRYVWTRDQGPGGPRVCIAQIPWPFKLKFGMEMGIHITQEDQCLCLCGNHNPRFKES